MEILINLAIVIAKFIPAYMTLLAVWVITKRFKLKKNSVGLKDKHIKMMIYVATALVIMVNVFALITAPSLVPKNTIDIRPQPVYNEPSQAKVQDLTLQPKMNDEERAERFDSITTYKDTNQ